MKRKGQTKRRRMGRKERKRKKIGREKKEGIERNRETMQAWFYF